MSCLVTPKSDAVSLELQVLLENQHHQRQLKSRPNRGRLLQPYADADPGRSAGVSKLDFLLFDANTAPSSRAIAKTWCGPRAAWRHSSRSRADQSAAESSCATWTRAPTGCTSPGSTQGPRWRKRSCARKYHPRGIAADWPASARPTTAGTAVEKRVRPAGQTRKPLVVHPPGDRRGPWPSVRMIKIDASMRSSPARGPGAIAWLPGQNRSTLALALQADRRSSIRVTKSTIARRPGGYRGGGPAMEGAAGALHRDRAWMSC